MLLEVYNVEFIFYHKHVAIGKCPNCILVLFFFGLKEKESGQTGFSGSWHGHQRKLAKRVVDDFDWHGWIAIAKSLREIMSKNILWMEWTISWPRLLGLYDFLPNLIFGWKIKTFFYDNPTTFYLLANIS